MCAALVTRANGSLARWQLATHAARAAPAAADVGFAALNISADASFSDVVLDSNCCELWQLWDGEYYVKKERVRARAGGGGPLG